MASTDIQEKRKAFLPDNILRVLMAFMSVDGTVNIVFLVNIRQKDRDFELF